MKTPIGKITTGVVPGGFRGKFATLAKPKPKGNYRRCNDDIRDAARAFLERRPQIGRLAQ